ncbi:MAG: flavodoxin family protein [Nanoarchaeota archaeon]
MRSLIVYYSRTQTTRLAVDSLSRRLPVDIFKLEEDVSRGGLLGWLRAGRDAFKKRLSSINKPTHVPSRYPLVILAMPLWVGTIPPAMRTYIRDELSGAKRVAFLLTQGGRGQEKVLVELERLTGQAPVATVQMLKKDVVKNTPRFKRQLETFVNGLDLS